jgi:hypothetical protein
MPLPLPPAEGGGEWNDAVSMIVESPPRCVATSPLPNDSERGGTTPTCWSWCDRGMWALGNGVTT